MLRFTTVLFGVVGLSLAGCQQSMDEGPEVTAVKKQTHGEGAPIRLVQGLGPVHHAVTTTNAEAQKYFDQGLAYLYAFNHEAAARSFERAAQLDPKLAMAHWGRALVLGPNYNVPEIDRTALKAACDAVQQAQSLSQYATAHERAYIDAVARRYSMDPKADFKKLATDYKDAMKQVMKQYPQDLDAATLYAEAMMNLRPWKLYDKAGNPAEGTQEIVEVLEWVLARNPSHTGANHYYIHATEASNTPQRALPCAQRLPQLAPGAGHLVHMPAHVYIRTGDYDGAIRANEQAARVDEEFISCCGPKKGALYPTLYYTHNLHFLAVAAGMAGRDAQARDACDRMTRHLDPIATQEPFAEGMAGVPLLMAARLGDWGRIAQWPEPGANRPVTRAAWHFARGMANASTGKVGPALAEQEKFIAAADKAPETVVGNNTTKQVLAVARQVLAGRIAAARGDNAAAISEYQKGVALNDDLAYDEPPAWPWPVREMLGAQLLKDGKADEAEKVFRADLEKNPNNPRSLLGISECLKARGKHIDAERARKDFEAAWRGDAKVVRVEDF